MSQAPSGMSQTPRGMYQYTTPYEQTQQQNPWANAAQWGMGAVGLFNPQVAASPGFQMAYGQLAAGQTEAAQRAQYQDTAADIERMYGFQGQQQQLAGQVGALSQQQLRASDQYYRPSAVAGRYGQAMDPVSRGYGQAQRQYEGQAAGINQGYAQRTQDVMSGFQSGAAGVGQGYMGRLNTGMGMIQGVGQQGVQDINRGFGALGATQQANLQARGMGGTTIASDVGRGTEVERSAEQRRWGEDVSRMRTDLFSDLSGDVMRSREDLLTYGTDMRAGLMGEGLDARSRAAEYGAGLSLDTLGARGDIAQGGLDYRDQGMQNFLANRGVYGMAPIQAGWDAAQSGINLTQNINRLPPRG